MAKFYNKTVQNIRPMPLPDDATAEWSCVDVEYKATAYANSDMLMVAKIPVGYAVLDWMYVSPDIDSSAGSLAFSIGIALADESDLGAGTFDVWASGVTAAGTGVPFRNALPNALQSDTTVERTVAMKWTALAGTYAGSGKTGKLLLLLQG